VDESDFLQGAPGSRRVAGDLRSEPCEDDAETARSAEVRKGTNSDLDSAASRYACALEGYGRRLADSHGRGAGQSDMTSLSVLRSRRLHERAAHRLAGDPALREVARERLQKLRQVNPHGRVYHDRWQALLDGPLPRLLRAMTEASEQSDAMRQESPFTALVTAEERRRVFESIRTG